MVPKNSENASLQSCLTLLQSSCSCISLVSSGCEPESRLDASCLFSACRLIYLSSKSFTISISSLVADIIIG